MPLPIEACLKDIETSLQHHDRLVVQAPPGAGKTTLVPIALLHTQQFTGRILVIQPRRLAVYGAAHRMAELLDGELGTIVGYTTRYDQKKSPATRIEVLTEGIFLRMIQRDPELDGVSVVIFDEFHERSVANDLSLAFALESQQGLRSATMPLKVIVMSATLDGAALADWLEAPLVRSEGRSFPVVTQYHPQPSDKSLASHMAQLVRRAIQQHEGSLLVFLPGMKEINQTFETLENSTIADNYTVFRLHAALPQAQQQAAISAPEPGCHKIVLTTNVAETSITIESIRIVIDSGLARVARYDERKSMDRLVTEKISLASAEQRRGRAGRVAEGVCYRAWSQAQDQQRQPFSDPEMLRADLLPVALELAMWGCRDVHDLQLLSVPEAGSLARAMETLRDMGALHTNGLVTPTGKRMAEFGIHPRLAQLILTSEAVGVASAAIAAAAILSEGDPLRFHGQFPQCDLGLRLMLWQSSRGSGALHAATLARIKKLVHQLVKRMGCQWEPDALEEASLAIPLARAFPDHVAQLREQSDHRYLLANGKGVQLNKADQLCGKKYLVVLEAAGAGKEPHIRLAFELTLHQLEEALGEHFKSTQVVAWHEEKGLVESFRQKQYRHLILEKRLCDPEDPDLMTQCLLQAIRNLGLSCLPWHENDRALQQRVQWLQALAPESWPDFSDTALMADLEVWLYPYLAGMKRLKDVATLNLSELLLAHLGWEKQELLQQHAPVGWTLPTGHSRNIRYDAENGPTLSARMQEFFGLKQHPTIASGVPLVLEILSPAGRPIQITKDLPGFWAGSYAEVAKEMRGRYPKHVWPDDPASAQATTKTKNARN